MNKADKKVHNMDDYRIFYDSAIKTLLPGFTIKPEIIQKLASNSISRKYKRREIVICQGEPQHYLYFVLTGAFRSLTVKGNGNEVSNNFMFHTGEPFIVGISFDDGAESIDTVQAMENGELVMLRLSVVRELQERESWVNFLIIRMLSQSFDAYHTIMKVRTWSGAEKCKWLRDHHPELEDRIQAQYLAQYLDMEKTVFSRIRNELRDEKKLELDSGNKKS